MSNSASLCLYGDMPKISSFSTMDKSSHRKMEALLRDSCFVYMIYFSCSQCACMYVRKRFLKMNIFFYSPFFLNPRINKTLIKLTDFDLSGTEWHGFNFYRFPFVRNQKQENQCSNHISACIKYKYSARFTNLARVRFILNSVFITPCL